MLSVLIIDDCEITSETISKFIVKLGFYVLTAKDGLSGLELYQSKRPDIIMTDIEMPVLTGLEMVKKIRQTDTKTTIYIFSAFVNKDYLLLSIKLGIKEFIQKPIDFKALSKILIEQKHILSKTALSSTVTYSYESKYLIVNDEIITLTNNEILLIELMLKSDKYIITYEQIEQIVYYGQSVTRNAISSLVKKLRNKICLKRKNSTEPTISNIQDVGYRLDLAQSAQNA